ncbi:MAG: CinA family protein [Rhodobacteraceae bacterium]|nr:CinA family protein [Paracoccaceae bacterium]
MSAGPVLAALRNRGWMLVTAESCTGGGIAAAVTDIAGASDVLDRGFITYSNAAKIEMLGVSPATLNRVGAVSEEVARDMAVGALDRSVAQIAISVTGIAGPGGSEHKPEGRVCFGIATSQGVQSETAEFGTVGRARIRAASVTHALSMILKAV